MNAKQRRLVRRVLSNRRHTRRPEILSAARVLSKRWHAMWRANAGPPLGTTPALWARVSARFAKEEWQFIKVLRYARAYSAAWEDVEDILRDKDHDGYCDVHLDTTLAAMRAASADFRAALADGRKPAVLVGGSILGAGSYAPMSPEDERAWNLRALAKPISWGHLVVMGRFTSSEPKIQRDPLTPGARGLRDIINANSLTSGRYSCAQPNITAPPRAADGSLGAVTEEEVMEALYAYNIHDANVSAALQVAEGGEAVAAPAEGSNG